MGAGEKTETVLLQKKLPPLWKPNSYPLTSRNLSKKDLGGIIFGCKHTTFKECIFKQLFGLPAPHFQYVRNVTPGMALFLFNYSDKKLHGIFEALSAGQMNINPHAWTLDGQEMTLFPAQVHVKIRMQCQPLTEDQYKPVLADNYCLHEPNHFWFELDKAQTEKLISLFSASPLNQILANSRPAAKWGNLFRQSVAAVAHEMDRNSRTAKLDVQLGCTHSFAGNGKQTQKLEAASDQDATTNQGNVTTSFKEKNWVSLLKCQSDSVQKKDHQDPMNEGLKEFVPCEDQSSMTRESSYPQPHAERESGAIEVLLGSVNEVDAEISSLMQNPEFAGLPGRKDAVTLLTENAYQNLCATTIVNEGDDTKKMVYDENLYHDAKMDWDSSFELVDTPPLNATIEEEGCMMPKPFNEGSSFSSGIVDFEDNGDPPIHVEAIFSSEEMISEMKPSDLETVVRKLIQTIGNLKSFQMGQIQIIQNLEEDLLESKRKIQDLQYHCGKYRPSLSSLSNGHVQEIQSARHFGLTEHSILLLGGFNGSSWLRDLDLYSPSDDVMQSLESMSSLRSYASVVTLNDELYVIGGRYGISSQSWYDTVESYNIKSHRWISCPALNRKKGSSAGVCLSDKIFVIGGGNETECFSEVEMLDLDIGKWIFTRSMVKKRFAPAAAQMNGALYVVGGYDGQEYLTSMERFDPRECSWTLLRSMTTKRGCHSLAALNEKLYAIGGYGVQMIPTVEMFEPRVGSWMTSEPMTNARGYMGTVVLGNTICVMGGMQKNEVLDTVECYSEGKGWQLTDLRSMGKRSCFSAVQV